MQEEEQTTEFDIDQLGEPLIGWQVDEYDQHDRAKGWYVLAAILGVVLIVYSVATANFLFAVIILMVGVIMLLSTFTKPEKAEVVVTTTGVVVGDMYYDYQSISDFSLVYDPPDIKILYLDFHSPWHPLLSIPLEDVDPNMVRESLLPFCMENLDRGEEGLTDTIKRLYKL
jgi:hypothetical protein